MEQLMVTLASMLGNVVGLIYRYTVLALVLMFFGIGVSEAEEFDITATTLIVHWYDSELELQDALDDRELAGMAECEWRPEFNISFCELWLVTPTDSTDEYNFDTIGHELYHALKGEFHE
jgi:hypothetical protein